MIVEWLVSRYVDLFSIEKKWFDPVNDWIISFYFICPVVTRYFQTTKNPNSQIAKVPIHGQTLNCDIHRSLVVNESLNQSEIKNNDKFMNNNKSFDGHKPAAVCILFRRKHDF